jgi:transposase
MDLARIHEGVWRMRFEAVLGRSERSELSQVEAAALLGVSERTFRRWRDRYLEAGSAGLADGRLRPSLRRPPVAEIERRLGLYRSLYRGFTVKHFHEQLGKRHGYTLGCTGTKLRLQRAGLVAVATKRSAHRKKRPRRPIVGMLLQQDASTHAWFSGLDRQDDLVVTLDDATSAIYSAFLVTEEGTASSFRGLREVVAAHGLFRALYTDRGSHYFHTPEAGGAVSKTRLTQVGRALRQLGIEHIAAYSPEARGRSERAFRTLQDRLPNELALAGIGTVEAANRWLAEAFTPQHNAAFAVAAEQDGTGFVVDRAAAWRGVLCIQEDRVGGNDNTVRWRPAVPATATQPAAATLRQGDRPGAGVSGCHAHGVSWPAPPGRL